MRVIQEPGFHPGCCAVTGSAEGPFLDTQRELIYSGRFMPTVEFVREMGSAVGLEDPEPYRVRLAEKDAMLEEYGRALDELFALAEEYERLREAVACTLEQGAVIERHRGQVRLRPRQGLHAPADPREKVAA